MKLNDTYDKKLRFWQGQNRGYRFFILLVFVCIFLLFFTLILDFRDLQGQRVRKLDWDALKAQNPDIVAWLQLDDTSIDNPVVQGKDDFEYLDKDFYGNYYKGGTLFLSSDNNGDFKDNFNIIYGHDMVGPIMFGELSEYFDKGYFSEHRTGTLETPTKMYDLKILTVFHVDAYDKFYNVGELDDYHKDFMKSQGDYKNFTFNEKSKIVAFSTCTRMLSDERTVVVAQMDRRANWDGYAVDQSNERPRRKSWWELIIDFFKTMFR